MIAVTEVDYAVQDHLNANGNADTALTYVTADDLASYANVSRAQMSTWLQQYRLEQRTGRTRFIIAAEGYGRAAYWRIIRLPHNDPAKCAQLRREHARYAVHDAVDRFFKDKFCEIDPALRTTVTDRQIAAVRANVEHQLNGLVAFVDSVLAP